jgi:hypothetical protein
VAVLTAYKPFRRSLPPNIGAATLLEVPALTLPVGLPTAVIEVIEVQYPTLVDILVLVPAKFSVAAFPRWSNPIMLKVIAELFPAQVIVIFLAASVT